MVTIKMLTDATGWPPQVVRNLVYKLPFVIGKTVQNRGRSPKQYRLADAVILLTQENGEFAIERLVELYAAAKATQEKEGSQ